MDKRETLDQASERKAADAAASGRRPWHTPVIDIVPLKNAENAGAGATDGGSHSC